MSFFHFFFVRTRKCQLKRQTYLQRVTLEKRNELLYAERNQQAKLRVPFEKKYLQCHKTNLCVVKTLSKQDNFCNHG